MIAKCPDSQIRHGPSRIARLSARSLGTVAVWRAAAAGGLGRRKFHTAGQPVSSIHQTGSGSRVEVEIRAPDADALKAMLAVGVAVGTAQTLDNLQAYAAGLQGAGR